jgi:hypothetical protein
LTSERTAIWTSGEAVFHRCSGIGRPGHAGRIITLFVNDDPRLWTVTSPSCRRWRVSRVSSAVCYIRLLAVDEINDSCAPYNPSEASPEDQHKYDQRTLAEAQASSPGSRSEFGRHFAHSRDSTKPSNLRRPDLKRPPDAPRFPTFPTANLNLGLADGPRTARSLP